MLGPLLKMKILAFTDSSYSQPAIPPAFPVLVNPASYQREHKLKYNDSEATGKAASELRFQGTEPEVFSCELHFDSTGIMDGIKRPDVVVETEAFKEFLTRLDREGHEPRHFMLLWGTLLFKGRMEALSITYTRFSADGRPTRAKANVTFKASEAESLLSAILDLRSPDLTHRRVVREGDTLANLCHEIYGDIHLTPRVAAANDLASYRRLPVGRTLFFPPLQNKPS